MGSARTIFDQNILGGMCARVCPTETLCEEACVREAAEGKPVRIGQLQRFATDIAMKAGRQFYERSPSTGRKVCVVGAGPAGLACAHRLAMHGHEVTVYEARPKAGGLNEYGIAAYKTVDGFARAEVDYVTAIGGIAIENGKALGRDFPLPELTERFDAVFLSIGLGGVNALGKADEDARGSDDAVEWIAGLRQASNLADVPVGRRVVVIGGGMTAIDAAVQAKALGAEEVTIAYRGPRERMKASAYEQELALSRGVAIRCNLRPHRLLARDGHVIGVEFEHGSEIVRMAADQVMKAIGQTLSASVLDTAGKGPELSGGRICIDPEGRTSMARVWAGGDCTDRGEDLTVTAVAQGRDAAESIHRFLSRGGK
jgi:glutamate synthase (NADPH/NADH) small chain